MDAPAFSLHRHNSSTQLCSELPAELLSARLIWVRRSGPSLMALSPFFIGVPTPSPSESGPETRSSPSATSRLALQRTPGLTVYIPQLTAGHAPRRSRCHQVGLVFRPAGIITFFGAAWKRSRNCFPTQRGGFCMPGTSGAFTASTAAVPAMPAGITAEVRPLASYPSNRGQS